MLRVLMMGMLLATETLGLHVLRNDEVGCGMGWFGPGLEAETLVS